MKRVCLGLVMLATAACQPSNLSPSGAERGLPPSFEIDPQSRAPEIDGNIFAFRVDRTMRPARSVLRTGDLWRNGNEYMLGFEFRVDPNLVYRGGGLSIARWQAADVDETLFDLQLNSTRGVTFLGRTCQSPDNLGEWQRVTMRVRWAEDATGYVELRCGFGPVQSAQLVFARSGFASNRGARCLPEMPCRPGDMPNPQAFLWQVGVVSDRPGALPANGVTVEIRRAVQRRLYIVFGRDDNY